MGARSSYNGFQVSGRQLEWIRHFGSIYGGYQYRAWMPPTPGNGLAAFRLMVRMLCELDRVTYGAVQNNLQDAMLIKDLEVLGPFHLNLIVNLDNQDTVLMHRWGVRFRFHRKTQAARLLICVFREAFGEQCEIPQDRALKRFRSLALTGTLGE